jgi:hypothetical protein
MYGVWNRWMSSEKHETWNMKEKHEREAWMRSMNALVMARQEDLWIVKYIWIMESIDVWIMELCQAWICHMKYGFWNYDTKLYLYLYLYLYGVVSIDCKREDSIWQQHIDITHPIPSHLSILSISSHAIPFYPSLPSQQICRASTDTIHSILIKTLQQQIPHYHSSIWYSHNRYSIAYHSI